MMQAAAQARERRTSMNPMRCRFLGTVLSVPRPHQSAGTLLGTAASVFAARVRLYSTRVPNARIPVLIQSNYQGWAIKPSRSIMTCTSGIYSQSLSRMSRALCATDGHVIQPIEVSGPSSDRLPVATRPQVERDSSSGNSDFRAYHNNKALHDTALLVGSAQTYPRYFKLAHYRLETHNFHDSLGA